MSPGNLEREALKLNATVGIEFEMVVPGVSGGDDDDMQADYDQDRRVRSISALCDFYHDGDYNGRRTIQEMREELEQDYNEWFNEQAHEKFGEVAEDLIRAEILKNVIDEDDAIEDYLTNKLGLSGQQLRVALDAGKQSEQITSSKQMKLFADENEAFAAWKEAAQHVEQIITDEINDVMRSGTGAYEVVWEPWLDEFRDDNWIDMQEDWLEEQGIRHMSDLEGTNYASNITWPFWTTGGSGGSSIGDVASDFDHAVEGPVKWADGYHSVRRDGTSWIVEPDSSIDADDSSERGLEFVSPPLELATMFNEMEKVRTWSVDRGCYTNRSTGLHMNVSVPGYSRDTLDYVKLAMLLGDEHVLEAFGRTANTYCKSAFGKIQSRARNNPETIVKVFDLLKNKVDTIASSMIHNSYTDKYTSINVKDTHVEFRGPGGDYLDDKVWAMIKSTLCRFVVALDAACDPQKHRKEYMTKLYKALSPELQTEDDTLRLFAIFSSGDMSRENFMQSLRQRSRERQHQRNGADQRYWWTVYRRDNPHFRIEVVGTNREDAIEAARNVVGTGWRRNTPDQFMAHIDRPFDGSGSTEPILPATGGPNRRTDANDRPSREWMIRSTNDAHGVLAIRGLSVWAVDREQAIRVVRTMYPNLVPASIPDSDLQVTQV